jgi:uncharacterized membrane protein YfcA
MISSLILPMAGVFAASVLRGFTGFGFGLAAVPLLSMALPPAQVVPLVVTLQVVIGGAGLRAAATECDWRAVRMLLPGLVLGVPIGLLILTELPALVSGVISGLASMGGPPVVVYLLALGHTAARMRATAIVYFMLSGCISLIPMSLRGLITRDILIWSLASLPVLFGGSWIGTLTFHKAKPRHHRMVALITLSALAALLIGRGLLG